MKLQVIRDGECIVIREDEMKAGDVLLGVANWDYDISDEQGLI